MAEAPLTSQSSLNSELQANEQLCLKGLDSISKDLFQDCLLPPHTCADRCIYMLIHIHEYTHTIKTSTNRFL